MALEGSAGGGDPTGTDVSEGSVVDSASTGAVEGPSISDVDLQAIVADADASAADALRGFKSPKPFGAPATEDGAGRGTPQLPDKTPDPLDQFVDKNYQGDRLKFLEAQFESRAEAKRLAEENKLLRERISTPATPPRDVAAELKARRDQSPDVQAIDQDIRYNESESQRIQQEQMSLANRAKEVNREIQQLQGQINKLEGDEKTFALAQLTDYRSELRSIDQRFSTNDRDINTLARSRTRLGRDLASAEAMLADSLQEEEQANAQRETNMQRTRSTFEAAYDYFAKEMGVDLNNQFARQSVRLLLAEHLDDLRVNNNDMGLDATGIANATRQLITAYAKEHNIKPPVAPPARSTPRQTLMPRRVNASGDIVPSSKEEKEMLENPEFWRQRARRVRQGIASKIFKGPLS